MAIPRRATRMFRSLRAERRTLRQGLVALVLSTVAGFVAGLTLSGIGDTLTALPGLIILIPAAVGHARHDLRCDRRAPGHDERGGDVRGELQQAAACSTRTSTSRSSRRSGPSLWLAVLAKVAASAFGQPSISIWSLITISVVGGALGSVFILLVTVGLSILSYRRGLGPGLGVDADGHRARRHGHAPDALPRDVPGAQPDRERGRVRHLSSSVAALRHRPRVHRERLRRAARSSSR